MGASWKLASLSLFVRAQVKTGKEDVVSLEEPPSLRIHAENKLELVEQEGMRSIS